MYAPQKGQVTVTLRASHTRSNAWETARKRTSTKENQLTMDTPEARNTKMTYNDMISKTRHYGDTAETSTTAEYKDLK